MHTHRVYVLLCMNGLLLRMNIRVAAPLIVLTWISICRLQSLEIGNNQFGQTILCENLNSRLVLPNYPSMELRPQRKSFARKEITTSKSPACYSLSPVYPFTCWLWVPWLLSVVVSCDLVHRYLIAARFGCGSCFSKGFRRRLTRIDTQRVVAP